MMIRRFNKTLLFLTLLLAHNTYGQDSTLVRFETAIEFLSTNRDLLAEKWKEVMTSSPYISKEALQNGMNFKVSDTFSLRSIKYFDDTLAFYGYAISGCDGKLIIADQSRECEFFEPYKDPIAEKMIKARKLDTDTDFVAGFSRPYKDYICCEIWHKMNGQRYKNRFGEAIRVFFLFNADGTIKKVHYKKIFK